MFNQIKPGHVLRFATCPSTIASPMGTNPENNDNTAETPWPNTSTLGQVTLISHPSGAVGAIAADVALRGRAGASTSRSVSYSPVGRMVTPADRPLGQETCDFVGYTDGKSYYINSARTVFSKDFSGCLMVAYTQGAHRRVAHSAASAVPLMDCKQAFLTTIQGNGAVLHGWFRPFRDAVDGARRFAAYQTFAGHMGNNPYAITTFGVITAAGQAWAIDAFKPHGITGSWVVTHVAQTALSNAWIV
ncbi:MAG: hypothetical protein MUF73_01025 [Rhodobacteraceae bacterium]|jgi:hypothetical protein|nr:hypothetical protein [Paracoccaceae bacterium]